MLSRAVSWCSTVVAAASLLGCKPGGEAPPLPPAHTRSAEQPGAAGVSVSAQPAPAVLGALSARLKELAARAGGRVGIAVQHVELGWSVAVGDEGWLPLQSVYKLPLAVAVAREVQAGRASWEQGLTVTEADRVPGALVNQQRWQQLPRSVRVRELLEYSLVESDNIASEKLVALIGGKAALVTQMLTLGFAERPVQAGGQPAEGLPHHAPALPFAKLLAGLERGEVLPDAQREVLWEMMRRARTGERRIRAGVPAGTPVLEKTGTGRKASVTNDVGLITLPGGAGHLALAVLISGSTLPAAAQEDLIAEIARAAFHSVAPHSVAPVAEPPR